MRDPEGPSPLNVTVDAGLDLALAGGWAAWRSTASRRDPDAVTRWLISRLPEGVEPDDVEAPLQVLGKDVGKLNDDQLVARNAMIQYCLCDNAVAAAQFNNDAVMIERDVLGHIASQLARAGTDGAGEFGLVHQLVHKHERP